MINILNDVQGISGTNLIIPFSLDPANLRDDAVTVEAIGKIGGTFKTLPNGCVFVVNDDDTEESISTIIPSDFKKLFVIRLNTTTHKVDSIYIRIYNKDISIVSPEIYISKDTKLEFSTKPKVVDFRPKAIELTDNVYCTYNGAIVELARDKYNVNIFISNNATSTTPVWEDVTNAYLAGERLIFKNTEKDNSQSWAVSVKYKIQKTNSNSTVQVSDIAMLVL